MLSVIVSGPMSRVATPHLASRSMLSWSVRTTGGWGLLTSRNVSQSCRRIFCALRGLPTRRRDPRRLFHPPLPPPSSLWLDRQHRGSMRVHLATATSLARHSLHPFLPSFFFEWVSPSLFSESEVILKTCFIPSLLPSFFVTRAAPDLLSLSLSLSSHPPVI